MACSVDPFVVYSSMAPEFKSITSSPRPEMSRREFKLSGPTNVWISVRVWSLCTSELVDAVETYIAIIEIEYTFGMGQYIGLQLESGISHLVVTVISPIKMRLLGYTTDWTEGYGD